MENNRVFRAHECFEYTSWTPLLFLDTLPRGLLRSTLATGEILVGYQYTIEDLLHLIRPSNPRAVDSLLGSYRVVEHGLVSVGLKIHCLGEDNPLIPLMNRLGGIEVLKNAHGFTNHYRSDHASLTVVLPPVGSATTAIRLLESIGVAIGSDLFNNPLFQLQICSPGRFSPEDAALLAVGFYLGSDTLRRYELSDFQTTFSSLGEHSRGNRIVLYDAHGTFDPRFAWWGMTHQHIRKKRGKRLVRRLKVSGLLPIDNTRTDLLIGVASRTDLRNVNLLATLLAHSFYSGWWRDLGNEFRRRMKRLLAEHQIAWVLSAPWVYEGGPAKDGDELFIAAFREVMDSAFEEAGLYNREEELRGLLSGVHAILWDVRHRMESQAIALQTRGDQ